MRNFFHFRTSNFLCFFFGEFSKLFKCWISVINNFFNYIFVWGFPLLSLNNFERLLALNWTFDNTISMCFVVWNTHQFRSAITITIFEQHKFKQKFLFSVLRCNCLKFSNYPLFSNLTHLNFRQFFQKFTQFNVLKIYHLRKYLMTKI